MTSEARVVVTRKDGTRKVLSSEEFAKYTESEGESLDFSEFDRYPRNATIIEPVFSELRSSIAQSSPSNVIILTARSNPGPVEMFLAANKIPKIHVEAVGSSDPMAKAVYILRVLKEKDEIDTVRVFEDNVRNIRTIRKVMSDTGVALKTNRVKNGLIS